MWASICPKEQQKANLEDRSTEFMAKLKKAGIGSKPIVWVAHSMGGLLVKNILHKGICTLTCLLNIHNYDFND